MSNTDFPGNDGYTGAQNNTDGLAQFNALSFITQQILAGIATAMLVQVKSVTPGVGLLPGTVSVQPMVNQVDGYGNSVPHGEIFNIPYQRAQGGVSAVILDPAVNDIGLAVFCMRDISSVKANKSVSNPGSRRVYDMADGCYLGNFLNGIPTQYIQFALNASGIVILSPALVEINAPTTNTTGNLVAGTGCSGSFTTPTGQVVTVQDGIITNIF